MMIPFSETARINKMIQSGGGTGMSELQFFAKQISLWKNSQQRMEQIAGELYYNGEHDILKRKRTMIGEGGLI
ncbi:MAG: phage portal protein, partial [Alphaproteobacteria bacterium]|nr:phage portal protein [Alphaproteobacteria bacterium]